MNAENKELQHLAKRACASYLRGVYLMKDKDVFDVSKIDTQQLASAHGLLNAPQVAIVSKTRATESGEELDDEELRA